MSTQGKDQRQSVRQAVKHFVPVSATGWNGASVWAMDISNGGIRLALDRRVKPGDRFTFQSDGVKCLQAEVCNVRQTEDGPRWLVGLRWINKNPVSGWRQIIAPLRHLVRQAS